MTKKKSSGTENKNLISKNDIKKRTLNVINIALLKSMFILGTKEISDNFEYIDELNVFPVPDGDTGTNMKVTFEEACKTINDADFEDLHALGKKFRHATLMNARGNSGVISSQIIRGFTNGFNEGQKEVNIEQLVQCFVNAKTTAYTSVINPVEGTILTVIRMISEYLTSNLSTFKNINDVMEAAILSGNEALAKTPELLPELKEVGVVDSGGYGLMKFISGMYKAFDPIDEAIIEKQVAKQIKPVIRNTFIPSFIDNNEGFGYCCEFICAIGSKVEYNQPDKEKFNLQSFRNQLEKLGDSLVIVADDNIIKVHIHSINPFKIYEYAAQFGEFEKIKIENMTLQFLQRNPGTTLESLHRQKNPTSFTNELNVQKIIATVPSHFLANLYHNKLNIDNTINTGEIGNPSIQNFIEEIKKTNSTKIIIVIDDSNYLLSCQEAIKLVPKNIKVSVINAKDPITTYNTCLGFIDSTDYENNVKNMNKIVNKRNVCKISRSVKDVKYKHINVKKNDYIAVIDKKIIACSTDIQDVARQLFSKVITKKSNCATIFYGGEVNNFDAQKISVLLSDTYGIKSEIINGGQSAYYYIFSFFSCE